METDATKHVHFDKEVFVNFEDMVGIIEDLDNINLSIVVCRVIIVDSNPQGQHGRKNH